MLIYFKRVENDNRIYYIAAAVAIFMEDTEF